MHNRVCVVCGRKMGSSRNKKKGCDVHKSCADLLIV